MFVHILDSLSGKESLSLFPSYTHSSQWDTHIPAPDPAFPQSEQLVCMSVVQKATVGLDGSVSIVITFTENA